MANPQKENGHVRIANDVLDALIRTRINGEARQVLDFIIRKTWGFGKKSDAISISQFAIATGLKRQSVSRALRALIQMNLIGKKYAETGSEKAALSPSEWLFNKDYDTWKPAAKKLHEAKTLQNCSENASKPAAKTLHTIYNTKDNIKDNINIVEKVPFSEICSLWNEICIPHYPKVTQLSDDRKKGIRARWQEHQDLDYWRQVFECLIRAEHCLGKSDGGWKASFDFIFKNNRGYVKLMEGAYDKAITKKPPMQDINTRRCVGKPEDFKGGIRKI